MPTMQEVRNAAVWVTGMMDSETRDNSQEFFRFISKVVVPTVNQWCTSTTPQETAPHLQQTPTP